MLLKTRINWLFNDIWCYLVIGTFDYIIAVFQQTVVSVYYILKPISCWHGHWNCFNERFDCTLNNAAASSYADWNSNDKHGEIQLYDAHADAILIQIREKCKKHKNIFDWNPDIIF